MVRRELLGRSWGKPKWRFIDAALEDKEVAGVTR